MKKHQYLRTPIAGAIMSLFLVGGPAFSAYTLLAPASIVVQDEAVALGTFQIGATFSRYITYTNYTSAPFKPTIEASPTFAIDAGSCGYGELGIGRSCQLRVSGLVSDANVAGKVSILGGGQQRNYLLTAKGVAVAKGVAIEPAVVDMGTTSVNKAASAKFSLINMTGDTLNAASIKAPAGVVLSGCDEVLPGKTCQVVATWKPLTATALSGSLTFTSAEGTYSIGSMTGNSQRGELVWDTPSVNLKGEVGKRTAEVPVVIVNKGNGDLGLVSFSGSDSTYSINNSQCPSVLAPGKACTVYVSATPASTTSVAGIIRATTSNSVSAVSVLQANVEGTTPVPLTKFITLEPSKTSLISNLNAASTATVAVKNTSQSVVNVSGYATNNSALKVLNPSTCTGSLAVGAQCILNVEYRGTAAFKGAATLTATTDGTPAQVSTSFNLWHQVPNLSVDSSSLDFGTLTQGTAKSLTVTVSNTGDFASNVVSALVSGTGNVSATGCGSPLQPGSSCVISVVNPANVLGSQTGTLSINGGLAAISVGYKANVVVPAPVVNVVSTGFSCDEPMVGSVGTCSMTLTNKGANVAIGAVATTVPGFAATSTCNTLTTNTSCVITLKGSTTKPGLLTVPVNYTVAGSPAGQSAVLNVKPYTITMTPNLGKAIVGVARTGTLTFKNNSGAALSGITYAYNTNYKLISSTCTSTLSAGASCVATVQYMSNVAGPLAGTASVQSSLYNNTFNFSTTVGGNDVVVSTPMGTVSDVLGLSKSGVLRRLTNNNDVNVSLTIPFVGTTSPWNMVWTRATNTSVNFVNRGTSGVIDTNLLTSLVGRSSVLSTMPVCATGLVLTPGASCDIVEIPEFYDATMATNSTTDKTVVATPVIQTTLGPVSWKSTFNVKYPSASLVSQQDKLEAAGMPINFTFKVSNPGSQAMTGLYVNYGTIKSNTCQTATNGVALTTIPGQTTCIFEATVSGQVATVNASLPQVIGANTTPNNVNIFSGQANAATIGTFNLKAEVGSYAGQWTVSPFKGIKPGISVSSIQRYVNSGSIPQKLMKDAYLMTGSTSAGVFTLGANTTCKANLVLNPQDSCDVELIVANPQAGVAAASAELAVDYGSTSGAAKATVRSGAISYEYMFVDETVVSAAGPYAKCITGFSMLNTGNMICDKWRETPLRTDVLYNNMPTIGVNEIMVSAPIPFSDWTSPVNVGAAQTDNLKGYYPTSGSGMRKGLSADYFTVPGAIDYRSQAVRVDVTNNILTYSFINSDKQGPASTSGNSMVYPTYYTNLVNTFDTTTRTFGQTRTLMPRRVASLVYDESTAVIRDKSGGRWELIVGETQQPNTTWKPYVRNGVMTTTYYDAAGVAKVSKPIDPTLMSTYMFSMQRANVDKDTGTLYWVAPLKTDRTKRIVYSIDKAGVAKSYPLPPMTEMVYGLEPGMASTLAVDGVDENQDVSPIAVKNGYIVYVPHSIGAYALPIYAINLNTATPKVAVIAYTKAIPTKGIGSMHYHLAQAYDGNLYFGNGRMFKWSDIIAKVQ
jgi:hypothetical protein